MLCLVALTSCAENKNAQASQEVSVKEVGEKIIFKHSFDVFLEDFGNVRFTTSLDENIHFSLRRQDSLIYEFPDIPIKLTNPSIEAISFYDADKDGRKDVICIIKSNTGEYHNFLYTNSGYETFRLLDNATMTEQLNKAQSVNQFKSIVNEYFQPKLIHIGPSYEWKSLNHYFRDEDTRKVNLHIMLEDTIHYDDEAIWIDGKSLVIEGGTNTHLYCTDSTENVMWISGSVNVTLKNVHMMHTRGAVSIASRNCSGRVLAFDTTRDIVIDNCDLNGSGIAGLHDNINNKNILIKNTIIHNCSVGAYTDIDGNVWQQPGPHPTFTFVNTEMYNNGPDRTPEYESN